ncbi:SCO family protein [Eleftheria terrae]|uniref:SCO family protein n=1 Tax=Eleftheria terrae TaxID=1597781 RepID=UPI00263B99DD|nr:SCO family protein [Eleftheria terrae]WKB51879.1 SCO family protein [Eleftheria terrae]
MTFHPALPRPAEPSRRRCLAWLAAGWLAPDQLVADEAMGPVEPPLRAPDLPLRLDDGRAARLPALLAGKRSALQFMFTGCTSICPVQGALFAEAQRRLLSVPPAGASVQLLSLSIDPLGDDPPALAAWRRRHGAGPAWRAAVPPVREAGRVRAWFDTGVPERDAHTTQVYIFDHEARLVWRTGELPSPAEIVAHLSR